MEEIRYEGKSKTVYKARGDGSCLIRYKDAATAYNGGKRAELAGKGRLNAAISHLIYGYLAEEGVKTHLLTVVDEVSALVRTAEIIPVEVIVRNIAAGSFSQKYGVAEGMPLPNTVVEFCLKSDALGDPMINESQITALSLATEAELTFMAEQAKTINRLLITLFEKAGILLVDGKYEFGRCGQEIILCDEISPDSCRLWDRETRRKLDKDRFRRDLGDVLGGYQEVLRRLQHVRPL